MWAYFCWLQISWVCRLILKTMHSYPGLTPTLHSTIGLTAGSVEHSPLHQWMASHGGHLHFKEKTFSKSANTFDNNHKWCLFLNWWHLTIWLYTWTSPYGQHQKKTDYILCSQRCRSSIQSAKTRLGADCGSDHELLISKFRLKLKKVGRTTRPFRYDLNHIPYDYTVKVRNRFKGLDLIDRVPDELWN